MTVARDALAWALQREAFDLVKVLIATPEGLDALNAPDHRGRTFLHSVAHTGDVDMVQRLITWGADLNAVDPNGETPLFAAARQGETKVIRLLLKAGADRRHLSNEEQMAADVALDPATARLMAATSEATEWGLTLIDAVSNGYREVARHLLEHDPALIFQHHPATGYTAAHAAADTCLPDMLTMLYECGAPLEAATTQGHTPLHLSAIRGDVPTIRRLLYLEADAAARDVEGRTPIILALVQDNWQAVEALARHGVGLTVTDLRDRTPLQVAAGLGPRREAMETILRRYLPEAPQPARLEEADREGHTERVSGGTRQDQEAGQGL
ncbi:ankyrin repeat domain-containing protein [Dyella psychrodurans]|uniref:Ankyrin repeat domain-containing protein n=1 Tax=Dyella psychrodurans TaxID=1927960 RepID=A0A370XBR9_9GAMM|nr:ankyrin repeat domain-containing protein [Dyella psychrodurans]RDS85874.1 ankyrin repeat domain-containing protein [Dyella psychrodurans]